MWAVPLGITGMGGLRMLHPFVQVETRARGHLSALF